MRAWARLVPASSRRTCASLPRPMMVSVARIGWTRPVDGPLTIVRRARVPSFPPDGGGSATVASVVRVLDSSSAQSCSEARGSEGRDGNSSGRMLTEGTTGWVRFLSSLMSGPFPPPSIVSETGEILASDLDDPRLRRYKRPRSQADGTFGRQGGHCHRG